MNASASSALIAPPSPAKYYSGAGSSNETVEVTAEAPKIETTTAQVTHTFSEKDLRGPVNTNGTGIVDALKQRADKKKAQARLSAELRSVYDCYQKRAVSGTARCTLPSSGMVEVELQLNNTSADVVKALQQAGLTIKSGEGTTSLTGKIEVAKLEDLAVIDAVKSVSKAKEHLSVVLTPS
jgi:hypothetical protein